MIVGVDLNFRTRALKRLVFALLEQATLGKSGRGEGFGDALSRNMQPGSLPQQVHLTTIRFAGLDSSTTSYLEEFEATMDLVECSYERHAEEILDILNETIVSSTALYEYKPRTLDSMVDWFKAKEAGRFPVLGVEDAAGRLLGFASYGVFRGWPAYKYSVEHSVYVHSKHRGEGIGSTLMKHLIAAATRDDYHVMVAGIDVENSASITFHKKLGFVYSGTIREVGFKFGRWLDLAFYQLTLATPFKPVDGERVR